jgi:hypothetical protein
MLMRMSASGGPLPRGVRLGRFALGCAAAAVTVQPFAVVIAVRGNSGDGTAGGILLVLVAACAFALTAVTCGVVSLVRLRGSHDRLRIPALLAVLLGAFAVVAALGIGVASLLIASKGGWIYLS